MLCSAAWEVWWPTGGGGGDVLHQILGSRVQHTIKNSTWTDLKFCNMPGQKDLRSMKKGGNLIENQDENWYKMLKNC